MPTGFTSEVANGNISDLRSFALLCARGMGALVTLRDEPHDAPFPERLEPSTKYHDERIAQAREAFAKLETMGEADREAACAEYNRKVEADRADAVARNTETLNRYNAMLAQVTRWNGAPEGLKEFMLSQLLQSKDFDCGYDPTEYMPKPLDVSEWYRTEFERLSRDIGYHEGERAKEVARTVQRNAWLAQLHASLPPKVAPVAGLERVG
jgi:hypothetical protein